MYQTNTIIGIEHQCYDLAPQYIISYLKKRGTHKYQIGTSERLSNGKTIVLEGTG